MTIVRMKKVTLVGMVEDESRVLGGLQELGCVHLALLPQNTHTLEEQKTAPTTEATDALRYLQETRHKRRQLSSERGFNIHEVAAWTLRNRELRRATMDRRDELVQRLKDLDPWGNFTLAPVEEMDGERLWFYALPRGKLKLLQRLELPWQVVHLDPSTAWVVVVSPDEPSYDLLPVPRTHVGSKSLGEVKDELDAQERILDEVDTERQSLTRWITLIQNHMARAEDQAELEFALDHSARRESCFVIQGWVPIDRLEELKAFAGSVEAAVVFEDPMPDDHPPTLLRTFDKLSAGEDLVRFYQTPSYYGSDPSSILFFSFALFFAMIVSDAGYAALLGVVLGASWRALGRTDAGRHWRVLFALIVSMSLVWGVMVGSYFGLGPPLRWLAWFKRYDLYDFKTMMNLSIVIGALHIAVANIQTMVLWWGDRRALVPAGWIAVLLGGLDIGTSRSELSVFGYDVGPVLLVAGLVTVFLFSGSRPFTSTADLLRRLFDGARELTRITQMFADILSYLRLFALGLASASLALTFNQLARNAAESTEGIGLLAAILIVLAGHTLNLALALVSGVVHGLRLNYIEFYNWGLVGEGVTFRPFRKKEFRE